jgi:hypothetical protein
MRFGALSDLFDPLTSCQRRLASNREVPAGPEARHGEVSRQARMRKVLAISVSLTVVALLIIYFAFAS